MKEALSISHKDTEISEEQVLQKTQNTVNSQLIYKVR